MTDKEKVIKGLEICYYPPSMCEDCPYCEKEGCNNLLCQDALELLKAQEPVLLKNPHKPYAHVINANSPWISRCPKCGKKVEGRQTKFCKYCGQAVRWE